MAGGERRHRRALARASRRIAATGSGGTQRRPSPDTHSEARRFSPAGTRSGAGHPGVPASAAGGCAAHPPDLREMAGGSPLAHHGALHGEPRLAGLLRHRNRGHGGEPGHAGRAAFESGTAGLAGRGVHGFGLEHEETAPPDRDFGGVSPVLQRLGGTAGEGSRQPAVGARAAFSRGRGNGARYRAGGQRSAQSRSGRPQRVPSRARVSVPAAGQLCAQDLDDRHGPGALPPRAVHVPFPLRTVSDAAGVRRAQRRNVVRAARALQHAAAGAHHAQRAALRGIRAGPGAAGHQGRRRDSDSDRVAYAFRLCTARRPTPPKRPMSC